MRKIAVSACLLGQKVRYDGSSKNIPFIAECFSKQFEIIPVCPEFEAGFGIPRPPMHIVKSETQFKVVLVEEPFTDLTKALLLQTQIWINQNKNIAGLIVKARSPSCAYKTAKVQDKKQPANNLIQTNGLFVSGVLKKLHRIPIIDEDSLSNVTLREAFIQAVKSYSK